MTRVICQDPKCRRLVSQGGIDGAAHMRMPDCGPAEGTCGAWPNLGGCILPKGHNQGQADVVEAHQFPSWRESSGVRPLRNDPTVTNEQGGSQSIIPTVFGTLPLHAIRMLAKLQKLGDDKYGPHNWRSIPEHDHINHAFEHMLLHCTGDRSDDHLLHAAWRLLAAVEVRATRSTFYDEEKLDD